MGIQILQSLKLIHETGYVYNDLKNRNIIIESDSVKLIDFGNCLEYMNSDDIHMDNTHQTKFKGNFILSSYNVLNFGRPSRKDDLISLGYLFLYQMGDIDIFKNDTSIFQEWKISSSLKI